MEELTKKFSDINLSDLEDFEKEYQIKINMAGGPEMKPNVAELSHKYENKRKNRSFFEYYPPTKNTL